MPNPLIIWTFQRTGGTSLTCALSSIYADREFLPEPFWRGRKLESITEAIINNQREEAASMLDEVLDAGVCFKHCFELHSRNLNKLLLDRLTGHREYRHLLLMRNSEADRICSLFLAHQTDVWGKWKAERGGYEDVLVGKKVLEPFPIDEMLEHSRKCDEYRNWLITEMGQREMDVKSVFFEEIFTAPSHSRDEIMKGINSFLGVRPGDAEERINKPAFLGSQNSNKLYSLVPNYEQARQALDRELKTVD